MIKSFFLIFTNVPRYHMLLIYFSTYSSLLYVGTKDGIMLPSKLLFHLLTLFYLQIVLDTSYWNTINHFSIWGSMAVCFVVLIAKHSNEIFGRVPSHFPFVGNVYNSLSQVNTWLLILLTTVASVIPQLVMRYLKHLWKSSPSIPHTKVWRLQRARRKQTSSRSIYAFSHQEDSEKLITSGRNMCSSNSLFSSGLLRTRHNSAGWTDNLQKRAAETEQF
uniref:P-type ATPase C-terminal domain-containing protein n=1 Tax=Dromaius novaehollandiae TaxID=8790 RepID=A0A8C4JGU8_DRONO